MGSIAGWLIGIAVFFAILFSICVAMGACGYNVHLDVTRDGKRVAGVESQAGYQGYDGLHHHSRF